MNPKHVHYVVLEHLTGLSSILPRLRNQLLTGFGIAVAAAVIVLAAGISENSDVNLVVGVLVAGLPLGVLAQRLTLRVSLAREQLRLERFMIGKKGYVAPKGPVLNHDADLFSLTSSLVCAEPHLSPNSAAAAWHDFSLSADTPAVAVCTGWYGNDGRQSVFLYGDPDTLLRNSLEIWDLGHVRRLTETDIDSFEHAAAAWKRTGLTPVALAYVPLPAESDPNHTQLKDLQPHTALIGMIGIRGSRGLGDTYDISSALSAQSAVRISLTSTVAIAALTVGSVLANRLFNVPIGITLSQIIALKLFIEPIILASLSWDGSPKKSHARSNHIHSAIKSGLLLALLAYAAFIGYSLVIQFPGASRQLQAASAVSWLSLGLGLLTYMWWERHRTQNPLFLLALSTGILGTLTVTYATSPLLLNELLFGLSLPLLFLFLLELHSYSERHHSRQHILDLLKTSGQK